MKINILPLSLILIALACSKPPAEEARKSTVTDNVTIMEPIEMAGLNRQRTIRIYLPEDYHQSSKAYPVLYAHDGQNLFDDSTSYAGEWGLDESLNQIALESGFNIIVVGIDNGQEKRMNELSPWTNDDFGPAQGDEYMNFIVKQVKPMIDTTYRVLPDRDNTAIMGSSMGGLISHYAIYRYPEVFSKAIIFSPSYWYANEVWDFTTDNPVPEDSRIWLEIGDKEGNAVANTNKMHEVILSSGHPEANLVKQVDPEGEHNEPSWRRQFVPAVQWLFEISE